MAFPALQQGLDHFSSVWIGDRLQRCAPAQGGNLGANPSLDLLLDLRLDLTADFGIAHQIVLIGLLFGAAQELPLLCLLHHLLRCLRFRADVCRLGAKALLNLFPNPFGAVG